MKKTPSSTANNPRRDKFATFVSAVLFVLGLTLAFWAAGAPVAHAANPGPTPSSPTPPPGPGHQECVVCHNVQHNPHTITVDCNALKAHLDHGDYQGPCQPTPTPTPKPTSTPSPSPSATPTPGEGHQKCTVCHNVQHNPHTITIDCHALKAHLAHGDYEGACQPTPTPTPKKNCTVCHNGKDKSIRCDKVDDWLSHHPGDTEGSCNPTPVHNP